MSAYAKTVVNKMGVPRLIITSLFLIILITAFFLDMSMSMLFSDIIRRFGMFGILVLAMIPSIQSGTGPNFALPIGIICGLLGIVMSIEFGFIGIWGFIMAILLSLPIAIILGILYGKLLNAVKGAEMAIATYIGFSIVQLMCIGWVLLPFKEGTMLWPIGKGLRVTFTLENTFGQILNDFLKFPIFGIQIPTGLILFFLGTCLIVFLFTKSKVGMMILAAGKNPKYAESSGINIDRGRVTANVVSTILGAIGIIVYSQSFGFVQLYTAPLMMAFPAVASVLIGGATAKRAKISHAIIGVLLFQGLLSSSLPVANVILPEGNLSEIMRVIVQNGIILYALTKVDGGH